MGDWLNQLKAMMQTQPAGPPQRLGFAERLIAAGQRPSQNVEYAPQGPDYYDNPPDPRTAWTPLGDEVDAVKFENSIGLPSALAPGHERQTRAMPDISQGMYPQPMMVRNPLGGGEFIDTQADPNDPQWSNFRPPLSAPLPPRRPR